MINVVGYREVEAAVAVAFGSPYYVTFAEETGNDGNGTWVRVQTGEVSDHDRAVIEEWITVGARDPRLRVMLSVLAEREVIPAGEYLVQIDW
jgi:hypothetical protein